MKTIQEILDEPRKTLPGYEYEAHESYRGVNRNLRTNDDIAEAIGTAAGIDTFKVL